MRFLRSTEVAPKCALRFFRLEEVLLTSNFAISYVEQKIRQVSKVNNTIAQITHHLRHNNSALKLPIITSEAATTLFLSKKSSRSIALFRASFENERFN